MKQAKINEDLSFLIQDLTNLEKNKLLLMATIYSRTIDDIKAKKMAEFDSYYNNKLVFYKRNFEQHKNEYEKLRSSYENKLNRFFDQFNIEYTYLQNEIIFAQTNQKIAIANFVSSKKGLVKARQDNNQILVEKSNRKIYATAQKKLNYDVVIDECTARLKKCKEDTFKNIDQIFNIADDNAGSEIIVYEKGIFGKIKRFLEIAFKGKDNFEKKVIKKLEEKLKEIEDMTVEKVSGAKLELLMYISQLEKIRSDINLAFNETLNKAS